MEILMKVLFAFVLTCPIVFIYCSVLGKQDMRYVVQNCNEWKQWRLWPWWMKYCYVGIVAFVLFLVSLVIVNI